MFHVPGNGFIEAGELDEFLMALGREGNKVCRHFFFFQAAEVNLAIRTQLLVSSEVTEMTSFWRNHLGVLDRLVVQLGIC